MKRRGKSSPARQATACKCKPYPKQHRMQTGLCPAPARRSLRVAQNSAATQKQDRWQSATEPGLQPSPNESAYEKKRPSSGCIPVCAFVFFCKSAKHWIPAPDAHSFDTPSHGGALFRAPRHILIRITSICRRGYFNARSDCRDRFRDIVHRTQRLGAELSSPARRGRGTRAFPPPARGRRGRSRP